MKKIFLTPIKWYQTISKLTPSSCRYYPTCSEYTKWLFLFDNPLSAAFKSVLRISRCNQLFNGGIDYPIIKYTPPKVLSNRLKRAKTPIAPLKINDKKSKIAIQFWLAPDKEGNYYIIKDFDGTCA